MASAGVTSITVGRHSRDIPLEEIDAIQETKRLALSFEKRLWGDWKLDGYYTRGLSRQDTDANNMTINRNLYAAADAVVNPATGQIVCRSTLQGLDPGCVPMNIFGDGSISQAAADYVLGSSIRNLDLQQDVVQLNLSGALPERFALPAGAIAFAAGVEYRRETSKQWSDPISRETTSFAGVRGGPSSLNNRAGGFQTFNPVPFGGKYSVREAYVEVGVPLLKDLPFAQSLDLNAAARAADYSNSGLATSWKIGATYQPIEDLRFRLTRSRDIRGPNILELFNPRSTNASNVLYKGVNTGYTGFSTGNPNLLPEVATTTTGGVIYHPSFIPGLNLSVDLYKIELKDAIDQLGAQGIVDECARGSAANCALIQAVPGGSLIITNPYQNLNFLKVSGVDMEAAYTTPLFGGELTVRALANYTSHFETQTPGSAPIDTAGDIHLSQPKWQGNFQLTYGHGPLSVFLIERYVGGGAYDVLKVEGRDLNINHIDAVYYTDFTARYNFSAFGRDLTYFVTVNNLFDKDPPLVPGPSTFQQPMNASLHDTLGRYTTMGVRFRF
jgi:outer membrane receptor protein involved in Fe transport